MQVIIELPDDEYESIIYLGRIDDGYQKELVIEAINDGTRLTKGHGRLFDEKDIMNAHDNYELSWLNLDAIKPILEADKED